MTVSDLGYTSKLRHNSSKQLNSICFSVALTSALAFAGQAAAGNRGGDSMYFSPPAAQMSRALVVGAASAADTTTTRFHSGGASSDIVAMVTEAAERHGVPVGLAHA